MICNFNTNRKLAIGFKGRIGVDNQQDGDISRGCDKLKAARRSEVRGE